jgi:hypothetical protein
MVMPAARPGGVGPAVTWGRAAGLVAAGRPSSGQPAQRGLHLDSRRGRPLQNRVESSRPLQPQLQALAARGRVTRVEVDSAATEPRAATSGSPGMPSAAMCAPPCSPNGYLSSRGGCQNRWHSRRNCEHGDSTTSRFDPPEHTSERALGSLRLRVQKICEPTLATVEPRLQPAAAAVA